MQIAAEATQTTDAAVLLGAAMPDFIGMYHDLHDGQLRAADFRTVPGLCDGLRLHQPTDDIFDALLPVKEIVQVGRIALAEITPPLGNGAVRGCAKVAPDILLDGVLLEADSKVVDLYESTREALLCGQIFSKEVPAAKEFERLVQEYFQRGVSYRYQDSETVAAILQRRFRHRPTKRLQFDEAAIPAVADALEIQRQRLLQVGAHIVALTTQELIGRRLREPAAA